MKNLLLFVLFGLFIISCGDEEQSSTPDELIVGKWSIIKAEYSSCVDAQDNFIELYGSDNCEIIGGVEECVFIEFTFDQDGTIEMYFNETYDGEIDEEDTDQGTYEFLDNGDMQLCVGDCFIGSLAVTEDAFVFTANNIDDCVFTLNAEKL